MKIIRAVVTLVNCFLIPCVCVKAQGINIVYAPHLPAKCEVQVIRPAHFAYGTDSLTSYLSQKLTVPYQADQDKAHGILVGRVYLGTHGKIDSITLNNSPHPSITKQVRQKLLLLGPWKPAKLNGNPAPAMVKLFINYPVERIDYNYTSTMEVLVDTNYVRKPATYRGSDADLHQELSKIAKWPAAIEPNGWYNASCHVRISATGRVIKSKPNKYDSVPERQCKLILEQVKNWNPATENGKPSEGSASFGLAFVSSTPQHFNAPTVHITVTKPEAKPLPAWFPDFIREKAD